MDGTYRIAYWKQSDLSDVRVMRRLFHDDARDVRPLNLVRAGYCVSIVDADATHEAAIDDLRGRGYLHSTLEPGFYVS